MFLKDAINISFVMRYKDSILYLAKKVLLEDENIHILLKRANLKCESEGSNKCFAMCFVNENTVFLYSEYYVTILANKI